MEDPDCALADPEVYPAQSVTADVPVLSTNSDPSVGAGESAAAQRVLEAGCAENLEANPCLSAEMPVALVEIVHGEQPNEGVVEADPIMADVQDAGIPATDKPVMEVATETRQLGIDVAIEAEHAVLANTGESEKDAVMQVQEHASTTEEQADAEEQVSTHQEGAFNGTGEGTAALEVQQQPVPLMEDLDCALADPVVDPEQSVTADIPVLSTNSDPRIGAEESAAAQSVLEAGCAENLEANPCLSAEMPVVLEGTVHRELPNEGVVEADPITADVQDAETPATDKPVVEVATETTQLSIDVAVEAEHSVLANTGESEKDAVMQVQEHASTTEEQADAEEQVSMHQEGAFNGTGEGTAALEVQQQPVPHMEDVNDEPGHLVVDPELQTASDKPAPDTRCDPSVTIHEEHVGLSIETPADLKEHPQRESTQEGVSDDDAVMADALDAEIPAIEPPNIETAKGITGIGADASHEDRYSEHQSTAEEQVSMPQQGAFTGSEEEGSAPELQEQHGRPDQEEDIDAAEDEDEDGLAPQPTHDTKLQEVNKAIESTTEEGVPCMESEQTSRHDGTEEGPADEAVEGAASTSSSLVVTDNALEHHEMKSVPVHLAAHSLSEQIDAVTRVEDTTMHDTCCEPIGNLTCTEKPATTECSLHDAEVENTVDEEVHETAVLIVSPSRQADEDSLEACSGSENIKVFEPAVVEAEADTAATSIEGEKLAMHQAVDADSMQEEQPADQTDAASFTSQLDAVQSSVSTGVAQKMQEESGEQHAHDTASVSKHAEEAELAPVVDNAPGTHELSVFGQTLHDSPDVVASASDPVENDGSNVHPQIADFQEANLSNNIDDGSSVVVDMGCNSEDIENGSAERLDSAVDVVDPQASKVISVELDREPKLADEVHA